jgi:hypothetical protein
MQLFSTSVLIALASGEVVEEYSLLQNKVSTDDGFVGAVHRATSDMSKVTDATAAEVDGMVQTFSQDLMKTSTALMQVSVAQQAALFRRAFQSAEVSDLVDGYLNLPEVTKHKVANSALHSEDLAKVFDTMPTEERTALLVQLDGGHMEKTVAEKTKTTVTNDEAGNRVTETVTRNHNGDLVHSHRHLHNARTGQTETSTKSKHHSHEHKHNTKTSQTETQTASNGHTHSHATNAKTGVTVTDSTGANGYQHHHDHLHTHQNGVTVTATNTRTKGGNNQGVITASHQHVQDNNGGRTRTVSAGTGVGHAHDTGNLR